MNLTTTHSRIPNASRDRGVVLLIAIFTLMLVSAVALALVLLAGTENSIAANYRTSTQSFYAAYAGIEEARGRLWSGHPNAFGAFVPSPMNVGTVRYVINQAPGEIVNPIDPTNPYFDSEYQQEWGVPVNGPGVLSATTPSISPAAGLPGPLYKWVRITPKTEQVGGIDVDNDGNLDNITPLYYDGTSQFVQGNPPPTSTGPSKQVYRITALSLLPNGARRLLQYDAAPFVLALSLPSALTLDGSGAFFSAPNSNPYRVEGADHSTGGPGCPPPQPAVPAIGVVNNADQTTVGNSIPPNRQDHYTGTGSTPNVVNVSASLPPNLQTVTSLENLLQAIKSIANYVVSGPASSVPNLGSPSSPVINYVDGDLSLSGNQTGYGILVVTGNYTASGNVGWNGVVLVVGQGVVNVNGGGNNSYNGGILVAKTRGPCPTNDSSCPLLANLGTPSVSWNGGGGNGIHYDSCKISNAGGNLTYRPLAFRELSQ